MQEMELAEAGELAEGVSGLSRLEERVRFVVEVREHVVPAPPVQVYKSSTRWSGHGGGK